MQTVKKSTEVTHQTVARTHEANHVEPLKISKRIGSTVYEVRVYFNQDTKEAFNDKILRLVKNDAQYGKVAG